MSRENRKPRDPLHTDYTPWFPKQHSQQAEGRDLTLLKHVCQEGGETGQAGGGRERGEKEINNNVDHDHDDNHSERMLTA